ncbi:MAG: hypothetical protein H8E44_16075 [Planctomycetes bacterium]|nr:hypothetical protein [Planctomycetota bacterium]
MKYTQIRNKLDTGDIVLFSGKGGISAGIKWFTISKWSHVGMVVRLPDWNMVLLWESTTLSNIADVMDGKAKQGVQLVALSERLRTYGGEAAIRRLSVKRTAAMNNALMRLRQEVKGRPYETSKVELVKAAYDGWWGENTENLSSLFCSELVAEAYQRMGLLSNSKSALPSNEFTPKDFSAAADPALKLLKNARLGKEVSVAI